MSVNRGLSQAPFWVAIVKLLLANKADATIKDQEGKTALDWARQYGSEEIAALLGRK